MLIACNLGMQKDIVTKQVSLSASAAALNLEVVTYMYEENSFIKLTFLILKSKILTSSVFIIAGAWLGANRDTLLPPRWLTGPWYIKCASSTGSWS